MRNYKMYILRKCRGLTQQQVARAVGISQSAYAMIERGQHTPRKETMKKLAEFFGLSVDELFFSDKSKP